MTVRICRGNGEPGDANPNSGENQNMSRPKTPLSEWPTDSALTPQLEAFAKDLGLDPESEWEAFHDSALANGRKYADWRAAFRTWCRNAAKWKAEKEPAWSQEVLRKRIGFTVPKPQPEAVMQALKDNEEAARETANLTVEERQAAIRKLGEIWRSIK